MLYFTADSRDGVSGSAAGSCAVCCCAAALGRVGEVAKWTIDYAAWAVPIGGKGLAKTAFSVEKVSPDIAGNANRAPVASPFLLALAAGDEVNAVQVTATDPDGDTLTFELDPLFRAENGTATITPDGLLTYVPNPGWSGVERFFYIVSDTADHAVRGEIAIRVNAVMPAVQYAAPLATPEVRVLDARAAVDARRFELTFPVAVSPTARPGDVYRITVKQQALDCDCDSFIHVSCYDLTVTKC